MMFMFVVWWRLKLRVKVVSMVMKIFICVVVLRRVVFGFVIIGLKLVIVLRLKNMSSGIILVLMRR